MAIPLSTTSATSLQRPVVDARDRARHRAHGRDPDRRARARHRLPGRAASRPARRDNVIVLRKGADSEMSSGIVARRGEHHPRAARRRDRTRAAGRWSSAEIVVLINQAAHRPAGLVERHVRGVDRRAASALRGQRQDRRGPHVRARHRRGDRRPAHRARASRTARSATRCASASATSPWSGTSPPAARAFESEIWGDNDGARARRSTARTRSRASRSA